MVCLEQQRASKLWGHCIPTRPGQGVWGYVTNIKYIHKGKSCSIILMRKTALLTFLGVFILPFFYLHYGWLSQTKFQRKTQNSTADCCLLWLHVKAIVFCPTYILGYVTVCKFWLEAKLKFLSSLGPEPRHNKQENHWVCMFSLFVRGISLVIPL